MSERRIMITGGGGFVGQALVLGFAELGWQVVAIDLAFDGPPSHARVQHVVADLSEGERVEAAGVDVIVHAAWVTTDPATLGISGAEYRTKNLAPLEAALSLATQCCPDAFVFVSSSGVFAADDAEGGLSDAHVPTGSSPYAATKLRGERLVSVWGNERPTRAYVVRLGYLFGPGEAVRPSRQSVSLVARWMDDARAGRPLEVRADDPRREWTFTPDLAAALERLIAGPSPQGPIHLGSPHVLTDSEVAECVAREIPGTTVVTRPAHGRVKPPMIPSDVPALRDLEWTDPSAAIHTLVGVEAVA